MEATATYASMITPLGEGGIGVIALWGPDAASVLGECFAGTKRQAAALPVGAIAHGTVRRGDDVLDEVIVAHLPPPATAMAGPYFEVNCHGGVVAVRAVLDRLQEAGARAAPAAEFAAPASGPPLSRASIRARALQLLPRAPTRLGAIMLLHQADGALSEELRRIEALLAAGDAEDAAGLLERLVRIAELGNRLLEPQRVALLGPPNVGKSTLFNALLDEERVIVHHEPGTTRDTVSEVVSILGVPFELVDAAGIGRPADELEGHAVGRAMTLAETCDVALLVFDASRSETLDLLPTPGPQARTILVGNKLDLLPQGQPPDRPGDAVYVSAREGRNLEQVEDALVRPHADLIGPCREGRAVPPDDEAGEAAARLLLALDDEGCGAALELLRRLCPPR